jgi:hypothetical protein
MEQMSLQKIGEELAGLREAVEEMREIILEDSLELADDVVQEIEEGRRAGKEEFVSQEDVEAEFLK